MWQVLILQHLCWSVPLFNRASLVVQMVKNLPAMQKTLVLSQVWEYLLEKGMATHSSVFWPGEFHGQRSLVSYSQWGHKESDMA